MARSPQPMEEEVLELETDVNLSGDEEWEMALETLPTQLKELWLMQLIDLDLIFTN